LLEETIGPRGFPFGVTKGLELFASSTGYLTPVFEAGLLELDINTLDCGTGLGYFAAIPPLDRTPTGIGFVTLLIV